MFKSFKNYLVSFFNRNSEENINNYIMLCNKSKKIDRILYDNYKNHINRIYYINEF